MLDKRTISEWNRILKASNYPPVQLVTIAEYFKETGYKLGKNLGQADVQKRLICVKQKTEIKELRDSLWHELLHCLFPYNPEWWIECAAYKLSQNNSESYGFYASIKGKSPRRDVPSKRQLLELIRSASYIMFWGKDE